MSRRAISVLSLAGVFVLALWMLVPEMKNGSPAIAVITSDVLYSYYIQNGTKPRDLRSIAGEIQRRYRGYEVVVHRETEDLFLVEVVGQQKQRVRFRRLHRKEAGNDIYEYVTTP